MCKIGTDIVKISRIENSIKKESFLKNVFSNEEVKYCKAPQNFAGIFAAKEAYFKAQGTGIIFSELSKIEVLHNEKGKPYFNGIKNADLSISHDGEYAVATVILWE